MWISTYLQQVNAEAAKGKIRAMQDQQWYLKHLDGVGKLSAIEPAQRALQG